MTTNDLRKFASVCGGIHDIVNNIEKEAIYEMVPAPAWYKEKTGRDEWHSTTYVPLTYSCIWSEWRVCVKVKYRGIEMYMWFSPFRDVNGTYRWISEYTWNGGPGRKLRKDAHRNLFYKTMEKSGLFVCEKDIYGLKHWVIKHCDRNGNFIETV